MYYSVCVLICVYVSVGRFIVGVRVIVCLGSVCVCE